MADPRSDRTGGDTTGTPIWLKVFGIVVLTVVVLTVVVMLVGGGGGHTPPPGMHGSP